jgi:hypothetical protein
VAGRHGNAWLDSRAGFSHPARRAACLVDGDAAVFQCRDLSGARKPSASRPGGAPISRRFSACEAIELTNERKLISLRCLGQVGASRAFVYKLCLVRKKFVDDVRLGQFAKCMIQRGFQGVVGAEAVGFSHGHFGLVVEALDDTAGECLPGAEVVQDQLTVPA